MTVLKSSKVQGFHTRFLGRPCKRDTISCINKDDDDDDDDDVSSSFLTCSNLVTAYVALLLL